VASPVKDPGIWQFLCPRQADEFPENRPLISNPPPENPRNLQSFQARAIDFNPCQLEIYANPREIVQTFQAPP
jgi:hypothetical protein